VPNAPVTRVPQSAFYAIYRVSKNLVQFRRWYGSASYVGREYDLHKWSFTLGIPDRANRSEKEQHEQEVRRPKPSHPNRRYLHTLRQNRHPRARAKIKSRYSPTASTPTASSSKSFSALQQDASEPSSLRHPKSQHIHSRYARKSARTTSALQHATTPTRSAAYRHPVDGKCACAQSATPPEAA
jgi:hypothetical protein